MSILNRGYVQTGQSISSQPINGAEQTNSQFQGDGRREFPILPNTEHQQQPKFYSLFPTEAMSSSPSPSGEASGQQGFGGYSETPTNQLQQYVPSFVMHENKSWSHDNFLSRCLKSKNGCRIQIQGVKKHNKMTFSEKNFWKILTKNAMTKNAILTKSQIKKYPGPGTTAGRNWKFGRGRGQVEFG